MCHVREVYSDKSCKILRPSSVDRMPLRELQEGAQAPVPSHARAAAQKAFEETLVEHSEAGDFSYLLSLIASRPSLASDAKRLRVSMNGGHPGRVHRSELCLLFAPIYFLSFPGS